MSNLNNSNLKDNNILKTITSAIIEQNNINANSVVITTQDKMNKTLLDIKG